VLISGFSFLNFEAGTTKPHKITQKQG